MKKFLSMFGRHWAKSPVKLILTLTAVALGTGILILSFTTSLILKEEVSDQLNKNGSILYVANGSWGTDGDIDQERPAEWDINVIDLVETDGYSIEEAVLVLDPRFNELSVGNTSYQMRKSIATGPEYFEIMELDIVLGSSMSQEDLDMGAKKVWISEGTAEILFGSVEDALNGYVKAPGRTFGRGPGGNRQQSVIDNYVVAGIYKMPSEVVRQTYGIGDVILPYTSMVSTGGDASMVQRMLNFMSGQFLIRSSESSIEKVQAEVGQIVAANYGDDISVTVWEGTLNGTSTYYEELRQAVSIFTVSINILGIVLLLTSSLGIFSIMVVESLNRRRDIALERALGASQGVVIKEFWIWSFVLSLIGAIIGIILALILASPVLSTIAPLIGELSDSLGSTMVLDIRAVLGGLALALGCGGFLGLLPAFSAVQGQISEVLRDV